MVADQVLKEANSTPTPTWRSEPGNGTDPLHVSHAFVELKSFGDLVVSSTGLRQLPAEALVGCQMLIAPHLAELCAVLAPPCSVEVLAIPDRNVPALFDVKKRGMAAALRSAFDLRKALSGAAPGAKLVIERLRARERFIVCGRGMAFPAAENVYLAFDRFATLNIGPAVASAAVAAGAAGPPRVALCPFSRVAAKNVPVEVVANLARICTDSGFEPELLLLEGEQIDVSALIAPTRVHLRRFDALAAALRGYVAVISADSLPAHLAEYGGTPSFVVSPVENRYWLPKRAFLGDHWGLIHKRAELKARLQRFLNTIRP